MTYFREVSDLLYQSQQPNRNSTYDYVRVKNFFRRAKIRDDFFKNAVVFNKYKIIGEERPEQVAEKIYGSSTYDWVVLISNNILNVRTEWPLSDSELSEYLLRKYTESELESAHHYETTLVKDSKGKMIVPAGKIVDKDFTATYSDPENVSTFDGETITVSANYNGYPVRGYLYYPTSPSLGSNLDVIILYHPSIDTPGVTPYKSALNFLNIVKNPTTLNITDKIIFSVAYPQDSIEEWDRNPALPQQQFPGLDYEHLYLGDNYVYAEAALLWAKENLNSFMSDNGISKTVDKVFTFGHSQGAYLVHRLNTNHQVDGAISNAPGPIDLLPKCGSSESNGDNSAPCKKLKDAFGSTEESPSTYDSISLKNYISHVLSPALFTQAVDDDGFQVSNMKNIMEPGLNACTDCAPIEFKYYAYGGHPAFITNTQLQQDIRNFVRSNNVTQLVTVNPVKMVTIYEYETQKNDKKRNIYVLRTRYLQTAIDDMRTIMSYGFSSQYVDDNTKKGDNLRIITPR